MSQLAQIRITLKDYVYWGRWSKGSMFEIQSTGDKAAT